MNEIEILNGLKTVASKCLTVKECKERNSAIDKAIQALRENVVLKARLNRALELPCKLGDTVYADDTTRIGEITDMDIFVNKMWDAPRFSFKTLDYNNGQHLVHKIHHGEIGETVFFTKSKTLTELGEMK